MSFPVMQSSLFPGYLSISRFWVKSTFTTGLSKLVFDVRFLVWVTFRVNVPLTNGWTNLGAKRFILKLSV